MEDSIMRTKLLITLVLVFALSICTSFAQPLDNDMGMKRYKAGLMNIPDLTEDQLLTIQKLRLEHQKEMLPITSKLQSKRLELRTMMLEESDQININKKIDEIGEIRNDLMKKRMTHRVKIRNLLTDKQKLHFDTMGFEKHGRRGKEFGHTRCFGGCRPHR